MQRHFRYIAACLLLLTTCYYSMGQITATTQQVYSTVNATTPYSAMPYLDFRSLYKLGADLSGGIIGDVNAGGQISLSVYALDESQPGRKGALVYGVYIDAGSTAYGGKIWNVEIVVGGDNNTIIIANVQSNKIKELIEKAKIYLPNNQGGDACKTVVQGSPKKKSWSDFFASILGSSTSNVGNNLAKSPSCSQYFQGSQPVIVEVTLNNATFRKAKIPGMGEFNATDLFARSKPLVPMGGKVTLGSHRGDWQDIIAPENTINAVHDMIAEQYDMAELDLGTTKDDMLIVFHDMGLNKRTLLTDSVSKKNWSDISSQYINNRFQEQIQIPVNTQIILLSDMLDYIKTQDPAGAILLNLDRSANDINVFKKAYQLVSSKNMLSKTIFKGRYNLEPDKADGPISPTVATIQQAFADMYPGYTPVQRNNLIKLMHFTPVLFDGPKSITRTNDDAMVTTVKAYIDGMISSGIADGFELNFKLMPAGSGAFCDTKNDNVFLLQQWTELGDGATSATPTRNFVQYIHAQGLPVGIFASVPEVCAIPDFDANGNRVTSSLKSGFIKENLNDYCVPFMKDQDAFDFRGDWDFYIPVGVDYVITDRPDALRDYLKAVGKF